MAERPTYEARSYGRDEVVLRGRFKPNGSSAITNTQGSTVFGRGWSVAYTNTGIYTLTITGTLGTFLTGDARLHSSTITDGGVFRVQVPTTSGGNTTCILTHYGEDAAGVRQAEDIASASDNFISFELVFQRATESR